ncbi:MAG TPA: hypothetical protein VNA15_07460 [Candidatus Angelobacter sp.]|nr:hypothetical protein [Candidatus Angelobacter sp.]
MNSYPSSPSISGCSAGCYTAFTSGSSYNVSDGVSSGSVGHANIFDGLAGAGLTWAAYCENGCPRGGDHFPCLQYSDTYRSPDCVILSGGLVGNFQVISTFNSANPPSYIWLTPDDTDNMHNTSIPTGDSWLKLLLVGSGSVTSPAPGSLLSTGLFVNPNDHTLLLLWWDECSSSCGSGGPFSNNDKAEIYYGAMVSKGLVDKTTQHTDYNALRTIEDNFGLSALANSGSAQPITGLFGANAIPPPSSCTNGATNPPSCNTCPSGESLQNGICTITLPPVTQSGNFSSPPWHLNAHGGGILPIITNGVLTTTTNNPLVTNYTGTYNSNVYIGSEDWCACIPTPLDYTTFSINGIFTNLAVNKTNSDFTIETTFYYYLPSAVNGTNCGSSVTGSHWLDIEIFYSRYNTGRYLSPQSYIGCGSSPDITYREVENTTTPGQSFQIRNFSITSVYQRALALQRLPSTTRGVLSGIEIGTEGYGITVSAEWFHVSTTTQSFSAPPPSTCSSPTGNIDSSYVPGAISPSTASIVNGTLTTTTNNNGSSYTGSYYADALLGATTTSSTISMPLQATSLTITGCFETASYTSSANFKIETSLFFEFANTQTAFGFTGNWLDTQIIFSSYNKGTYQPNSSYIGACGSNCLPYREIIAQTHPGQTFSTIDFNLTAFYQRALAALGLPATTLAYLYGVAPGTQGDGVTRLTAIYNTIVLAQPKPQETPPLLQVPTGFLTVIAGSALTFRVNATSIDGDNVSVSTGFLPMGATFNATTDTFTFTPTPAQGYGTWTIAFIAADDDNPALSVTRQVTVYMLPNLL